MTIPVKKISTFCKTGSGGTPSRSNNAFFENGTIPWVKSGELKNRYITEVEEYITDLAIEKSSAKLVSKGSLLIAMYGATVGEVSQLTFDATTNQAICNIQPDENVCDVNYLYRFLEASKPYLLSRRVGGGQPNISQAVIKDLDVPLPPLAEQRRIAAILDKADELRQKREQAIEKLDQLLQATFIDMFGDPVSNPKGWDKKLLSDLVIIDAPLVEPMEKEFENLLHYGPDRISKDSGKLLPALTAKEDMLISKKFLCDDRHILYSKIRPYLNKVAMVQEKCLCSADVYPVEPKSRLTKHFLWHILRSKSFLDHAETFSNRANIPKINRNQFLQYECIVPAMEVQKKFENISKDIQKQIDFQNLSLESIEKLFNALQNQAFNGTL
ncbi:restriction endonuclease subunit S [Acinetobacter baumannii]|nr:restriction endonuclease subunit S [Acinetobacter baumannii]